MTQFKDKKRNKLIFSLSIATALLGAMVWAGVSLIGFGQPSGDAIVIPGATFQPLNGCSVGNNGVVLKVMAECDVFFPLNLPEGAFIFSIELVTSTGRLNLRDVFLDIFDLPTGEFESINLGLPGDERCENFCVGNLQPNVPADSIFQNYSLRISTRDPIDIYRMTVFYDFLR